MYAPVGSIKSVRLTELEAFILRKTKGNPGKLQTIPQGRVRGEGAVSGVQPGSAGIVSKIRRAV
jgi:hypothetical protein